ncbi:MAG: hypothetical protein L6R39_004488 [Caloplaca ligustica]|nr:MAG: hypothetical protein L6R39_004488 [Caloplaca ligustica]
MLSDLALLEVFFYLYTPLNCSRYPHRPAVATPNPPIADPHVERRIALDPSTCLRQQRNILLDHTRIAFPSSATQLPGTPSPALHKTSGFTYAQPHTGWTGSSSLPLAKRALIAHCLRTLNSARRSTGQDWKHISWWHRGPPAKAITPEPPASVLKAHPTCSLAYRCS